MPKPPKTMRAASNQDGVFRITSRSLEKYAKLLQLDADQMEAAKALLAGHTEAVEAKRKDVNAAREEAMKAAEEDPNFRERWKTVAEYQRQLGELVAEAEESFLKDLRVMLTPEQAGRWVRVERFDRRTGYRAVMGNMPVSSTAADLVDMVDKLKLSPEAMAKVEPRLLRYEADLDGLYVKFKEAYEALAADEKKMRQMQQVHNDPEAAEKAGKVFDEFMDVSRRLRDLNRRTAKELQNDLGGRMGDRLMDEFRREMFPMLAQLRMAGMGGGEGDSRYAGRVLEAALALPELAEGAGGAGGGKDGATDARQSLMSVAERYYRDRRALYDEAERGIIESEDKMTFKAMLADPMGTMMKPARVMEELTPKLKEIDTRTVNAVKATLTPAQVAKLPPPPPPPPAPGEERRMIPEEAAP